MMENTLENENGWKRFYLLIKDPNKINIGDHIEIRQLDNKHLDPTLSFCSDYIDLIDFNRNNIDLFPEEKSYTNGNGLSINLRLNRGYYLFFSDKKLSKDDYALISYKKNDYNNKVVHNIYAPPSIQIIRDEIIEREGGLESIIEKIKSGEKIISKRRRLLR